MEFTSAPPTGTRLVPRLLRLVPLAALSAVFAIVATQKLADPDLPWHLANGKLLLERGALMAIDELAQAGRPVQYSEFVADALFAWLLRLGGPLSLQLLAATCAVSTAVVLHAHARRAGPVALPVTALSLTAMGPWLVARPATLSFPLLAIAAYAVHVRRQYGRARRGRLFLAALIPLHALWANMHGYVVVGLLLTLLFAGYTVLARFAVAAPWLDRSDGDDWGFTLGVAAATVLATCLNTAGPRLLFGPGAAARDFDRISEWQRPGLGLLFEFAPAALALIVVVGMAIAFGRTAGSRRPNLFDLGVLALGIGLAASAVRLIPIGAILVAPVMSKRLAHFDLRRRALAVALACSPLLAGPILLSDSGFSRGIGWRFDAYPEGAVRFVQSAGLRGPMWNHLPFGGWLAFRLHPSHRVLVDERTGWVHDPGLVERAIRSESDDDAFRALVSAHGIEWAVTRADEGLHFGTPLARSPKFRMVYLDHNSAVYVRRGGSNDALPGYRLLTHRSERAQLLDLALTRSGPISELARDARLAASQAPTSARAAVFLGIAALTTGDPADLARARELLSRHSSEAPSSAELDRRAREIWGL